MLVSALAMTKNSSKVLLKKVLSKRLDVAERRGVGVGVLVLVALDQRVGRVIVNGFEILALHHVRGNACFAVEAHGDVAHHVLNELRVVIGALGHVLFIRPLENAPQLARRLALGDIDEFLDPHVRALVVGAAIGDLPRTRTQTRDGHYDFDAHAGLAMVDLADQRGLVVHETLDAGHGGAFHDEIGKGHFDMTGVGIEPRGHLGQHLLERIDRDLALAMQDLDKARHVRALEVVRQVHVHVEGRDRVLLAGRAVLDLDRMANVLDADPINRNAASIRPGLHVLDGNDIGASRLYGSAHGFPAAAANLVAVRVSFKAGTWARQRSIAAAMLAGSSPAAARHSSRLPCSVVRSGMPMGGRGVFRRSPSSPSPQALPAPPATTLSSSVTIPAWVLAISRSSARSSGLTNRILTTVASKRSPSHSAGVSMAPKESSARPLPPRRRSSARPSSRADNSLAIATPGPAPRG